MKVFEVNKLTHTAIKKLFSGYVFNRESKGKYFVNLDKTQQKICKSLKLINN